MNYFPLHDESNDVQVEETSAVLNPTVDDSKIDPEHDSYLEMMGKAINPVMAPLGFHWRATVAALAGVPALLPLHSHSNSYRTRNRLMEICRIQHYLQHADSMARSFPCISGGDFVLKKTCVIHEKKLEKYSRILKKGLNLQRKTIFENCIIYLY